MNSASGIEVACKNCVFFEHNPDGDGFCHRHPNLIYAVNTSWCGEFESEEGATVLGFRLAALNEELRLLREILITLQVKK